MAEIVSLPVAGERNWQLVAAEVRRLLRTVGYPSEKIEWILTDLKPRASELFPPSDEALPPSELGNRVFLAMIMLEANLYDALHAPEYPRPVA